MKDNNKKDNNKFDKNKNAHADKISNGKKSGFMTFEEFKKTQKSADNKRSSDYSEKKGGKNSYKNSYVGNKTDKTDKSHHDKNNSRYEKSFDERKKGFADKDFGRRNDRSEHSTAKKKTYDTTKPTQPIHVELTPEQIEASKDNSPTQYVAICQVGLENVLADEIKALGAEVVSVQRSTVFFICDKITMYKANMSVRSAVSILKPLKKIIAHDYDNLYHQTRKINWHKMFGIDKNIRIDVKGSSHQLNHSQYVTHRIRDAIMDTFRKFNDGMRPSVDKDEPDIHIVVYLSESCVTLYLDSSGVPLFKRGYRVDEHFIAPLKEELAAGLVELTGWDKQSDVLDICCGSGTLLIEAAMIATNTPVNLNRNFAFQNWFDYNKDFFIQAYNELKQNITQSSVKLTGYEIDAGTAKKATAIVKKLGLDNMITIINDDFRNADTKYENRLIITNPPYGERLESDDETKVFALYKDIGDFLKQKCTGSTAFVFTGNFEAMKHIGLRTNRTEVYNGPIECRLLEIKCF